MNTTLKMFTSYKVFQTTYPYFRVHEQAFRVEYLTSAYKMCHAPGSEESIEWLEALTQAENKEIFLSNLKLLVDYKWNKVYKFVLADGILHLFYAVLLAIDTTFFDKKEINGFKPMKLFMICYTFFFLLFREFYQIWISGQRPEAKDMIFGSFRIYFTNFYNVCDFTGQFGYLTYAISKLYTDHSSRGMEYLHVAALFMLFMRAISQLRIIESTRYLIRMIVEVIKGMQ